MSQAQDFHQAALELLRQGMAFVSVTLVDTLGSAPQQRGARMLVTPQGLHWGTVGGGRIEKHCIEVAQGYLSGSDSPPTHYAEWNLQTEIGMTCGGVVRFFFELQRPQAWHLSIFGAGHVAQALVPILATLNCQLDCFDTRPDWLERLPHRPHLKAHCSPELAAEVANLPSHSFILSMTMGHAHDVPILAQVLRRQAEDATAFPFVGVIGSPAKAGAIQRDLLKQGFSKSQLQSIICPIGLPLGNNEPAEIAISITAQVLQERDRRLQHPNKWAQKAYQRSSQNV